MSHRHIILAIALLPACASAQRIVTRVQNFDCNLSEKRWDGFRWPKYGITQPRYIWHLEMPLVSFGVSSLVRRLPIIGRHAPMATAVGFGVLPHVRGVVLRQYPLDPMDVAFDAVNKSASLITSKKRAVAWLIADAALTCFGHP